MWWKAITDTIGGENGILGNITDVIDKFTVSKEEKLAMKIEIQKMLQEKEAMLLEDLQSARSMQIAALNQSDLFSKRFLYYLAGISLLLGFVYVFLITFIQIPEANQRFADTILGVVISMVFGSIFNFFFGSSQGSKVKTDLMDQNIKTLSVETETAKVKRKIRKEKKAAKKAAEAKEKIQP